jgi:Ca2+-binding RTX toxin-like protein
MMAGIIASSAHRAEWEASMTRTDAGLIVALTLIVASAQAQELGPAPRLDPDDPAWSARLPESHAQSQITAALSAVDTSDRDAVIAFFDAHYRGSAGVAIGWTGNIAGCVPGTTTAAYRNATLLRVNYFRAMAGLPAGIMLDSTRNTKNQANALMISAEGMLSHFPDSSWECYTAAGAEAAGNSNIAIGAAGVDAIDLFMDDHGANNVSVGHRRWILFPPQQTMGTGSVPATSGHSAANSLWVIGNFGTRPAEPEYVAWPPAGFVPYQALPQRSRRWSFSYPNADMSNARVGVSSGGVNRPTTIEPALQGGIGDNTLVWVLSDVYLGAPEADTSYDVTVSDVMVGGTPQQFAYQVTVINPDPAEAAATITPATLKFGSQAVNTTSTAKNVTVSNTGGTSVTLNFIGISGGSEFLRAGTCSSGMVLTAGSTCTAAVSFKPAATGARTDRLRVFTTASAIVYEVPLSGTGSAGPITGTSGADNLTGTAGDDTIDGKGGADTMTGLGGNDTYIVNHAGDTVVEASAGGTDTIKSSVTYTLPSNVENLTLIGSAAISGTGNGLVNRLIGNAAGNILSGGLGNDTLIGKGGPDRFLFKTALGSTNVDKLTDFNPAADTIRLENLVFKALSTTGTLAAAAFRLGTAASTAAHRIIYDPATGHLYYDRDGNGPAAKVRFATLTTKPALTRADFVVQ